MTIDIYPPFDASYLPIITLHYSLRLETDWKMFSLVGEKSKIHLVATFVLMLTDFTYFIDSNYLIFFFPILWVIITIF